MNRRGNSENNKPDSSNPNILDKKNVAAFFLLPGIVPQIKYLGRGGFGYLAYLIAMVYRAVRILPANHPYTQPENMGSYGIRKVVAAAANNVKMDRQNIDQVIIFFAVLSAILVLAMQILSFLLLMFTGDAFAAGPDDNGGIFRTEKPDTDIAFRLMREVFGIPDLFGTLSNQTAFHKALHVMLNFYNLAILLVAVLVFLYYVIVVVAETAQTGTPFGKRFSHIYAPFRLVIAIGLLVPLNHGLNGSQYITLYAAKNGSGLATTGWRQFNEALDNPTGRDNSTLIAETKPPDIEGLVEYMALAVTCKQAYKLSYDKWDITKVCVTEDPKQKGKYIETTCEGASGIASKDIKIMFGRKPTGKGTSASDPPIPTCGILVQGINVPTESSGRSGSPVDINKEYMKIVDMLWQDADLERMAKNFVGAHVHGVDPATYDFGYHPPPEEKRKIIAKAREELKKAVKQHYENARKNADFKMREEVKDLGWGGAGIWYNRIAQINGAYVVATMTLPAPDKWPQVAQFVMDQKKNADSRFKGCELFEPNLADNKKIDFNRGEIDRTYAAVFSDVHKYWTCDKSRNASNYFLDTMMGIFGLNGLMTIRDKVEGADGKTVEIHPLAKLSALGKGLVESAIRSLGYAVGISVVGGAVGVLSPHFGAALDAASSMFVSIATIGLSIGFLTFYILPFLPFIYFFFAVGNWVKSIFEAMVGAPLWALAHLRIDGDGLPGKMAIKGYALIFEIFLRPILTVFGLLGGMAIFTGMAMILNDIFNLVVENTAGVNLEEGEDASLSRHIVDVFFFTCVYAVILYMMAVSSFKMINLVPNMILRWMGESASAFSDGTPDPTQNLAQYATIGGGRIGGQIGGGLTSLGKSAGAAGGGAVKAGIDVFGLLGRRGKS